MITSSPPSLGSDAVAGSIGLGDYCGQNDAVTAADVVVHLTTVTQWADSQRAGVVRPASLVTEGFVHCSRLDQIADVANRFYRGCEGLVLLVIPVAACVPELRWEPPAHPDGSAASTQELSTHESSTQESSTQESSPQELSAVFPHLYGPIDAGWVSAVVDFAPGADGLFIAPVLA
jgi:uncharacterized protein (DUF952 family)